MSVAKNLLSENQFCRRNLARVDRVSEYEVSGSGRANCCDKTQIPGFTSPPVYPRIGFISDKFEMALFLGNILVMKYTINRPGDFTSKDLGHGQSNCMR